MPPSVFRSGGRVPQVVLLAQFVGDARGSGIDVARIPNDLSAAAAVISHVAERDHVDALVAWPRPRTAVAAKNLRSNRKASTRPAPGRKWVRHRRRPPRNTLRRRTPNGVVGVAVDPDSVDQHFALADLLFELTHPDMARGVVAIRDDHNRLFLILAARRHRHSIRD